MSELSDYDAESDEMPMIRRLHNVQPYDFEPEFVSEDENTSDSTTDGDEEVERGAGHRNSESHQQRCNISSKGMEVTEHTTVEGNEYQKTDTDKDYKGGYGRITQNKEQDELESMVRHKNVKGKNNLETKAGALDQSSIDNDPHLMSKIHVCLKMSNTVETMPIGENPNTVNDVYDSLERGINMTLNMYICGGCSQGYPTLCKLHEHLLHHGMGGSYHYNHHMRTAFPKYDSVCTETQTILDDAGNIESQFTPTKRYALKTEQLDRKKQLGPLGLTKENGKTARKIVKRGRPSKVKIKKKEQEEITDIKTGEKDEESEETAISFTNITDTSNMISYSPSAAILDVPYSKSESEIELKSLPENLVVSGKDEDIDVDFDIASASEGETTDEWFPDEENIAHPEIEQKRKDSVKKKTVKNNKKKKTENDSSTSVIKLEQEQIPCEECPETFNTERKLKTHIQMDHKSMYPYVCNFCRKKVFKTLEEYEEHMKQHPKTLYCCELCGKELKSREGMRNHQLLHSGLKPQQCHICDYRCRTSTQLRLHILHHSDEKPEQCDICGKAFYTKPKLADHLRYCRKDKQHKCPHCPKGFPTGSGLRKHIFVHTGEKPWICEICGFATNKPTSLKYHMRTHTGEKPFKCDQCDARLATRSTLVAHIRTHTHEKPFVCSFCGKAFSSKWNLQTHVRQHTGETPYKCGICGMGFKQNVLKKTHMRSHFETVDPDMHKGRGMVPYEEMEGNGPVCLNVKM